VTGTLAAGALRVCTGGGHGPTGCQLAQIAQNGQLPLAAADVVAGAAASAVVATGAAAGLAAGSASSADPRPTPITSTPADTISHRGPR
jgi:hypothetical protein